MSSEQQSGQSRAQTEWRVSGISPIIAGVYTPKRAQLASHLSSIGLASFCALQLASGGRMRSFILAAGALVGLTNLAVGQTHAGPYWSLGGFGNVVYPGTGHAPNATPPGAGSFVNGFAPRGGAAAAHPVHRRNNVVLYPVYYGGYGYGAGYGAGYGCDPSQGCGQGYPDQPPVVNSGAPGVVIN